jgi:hypothetical protein
MDSRPRRRPTRRAFDGRELTPSSSSSLDFFSEKFKIFLPRDSAACSAIAIAAELRAATKIVQLKNHGVRESSNRSAKSSLMLLCTVRDSGSLLPLRGIFAVSSIAVTCCVCLLTLLKSALLSECTASGGGNLRPVLIVCMVATVLSIAASAAYLFKSRAWTQAAAICSKWQPVYFLFMSVQRLVLRAAVAIAVSADGEGPCSEYENAVLAISFMWNCTIIMTAVSTMCCDLDAETSPALRRCAYGLLALVLVVDALGSVVWGNPLATGVSFDFSKVSILLDNHITSCIASQVAIVLHFLYVSCRSRRGRGWAYASLRFILDEVGTSVLMQRLTTSKASTNSLKNSGATASTTSAPDRPDPPVPQDPLEAQVPPAALLASDLSERQHTEAPLSPLLSRLRHRWLMFQKRHVSQCRLFVVPSVAIRDAGRGGEAEFAITRPAFSWRCLRPLQRLADAHFRVYMSFTFCFLAVPSIACYIGLQGHGMQKGSCTLVLNSIMAAMILGFLSSHTCGLDRVAVTNVIMSYRFVILVSLQVLDVASMMRLAYLNQRHPTEAAAFVLIVVVFCECMLLDCSPNFPASHQIFVSVSACETICFPRKEFD